jgi:hypothetical protein
VLLVTFRHPVLTRPPSRGDTMRRKAPFHDSSVVRSRDFAGHCPRPHVVANIKICGPCLLRHLLRIHQSFGERSCCHLQHKEAEQGSAYYLLHAGSCLTSPLTLKMEPAHLCNVCYFSTSCPSLYPRRLNFFKPPL